MFKISCHCGNIRLETKQLPDSITSCNCSICRRIAAQWAYFSLEDVSINQGERPVSVYSWGEQQLAFHHCDHCSCVTHYIHTKENEEHCLALNARMVEVSDVLEGVPVRYFDGADDCQYADDLYLKEA